MQISLPFCSVSFPSTSTCSLSSVPSSTSVRPGAVGFATRGLGRFQALFQKKRFENATQKILIQSGVHRMPECNLP